MKRVLFVCVENAGRSQIAEAFFNKLSKTAKATSAGTTPASAINPLVVQVMKEVGTDMSGAKPKILTFEMIETADKVITMGCGVSGVCPDAIVEAEDWEIEDPKGKPVEKVREIRDIIQKNVENLISDLER